MRFVALAHYDIGKQYLPKIFPKQQCAASRCKPCILLRSPFFICLPSWSIILLSKSFSLWNENFKFVKKTIYS